MAISARRTVIFVMVVPPFVMGEYRIVLKLASFLGVETCWQFVKNRSRPVQVVVLYGYTQKYYI
jgi:hypothetical protein